MSTRKSQRGMPAARDTRAPRRDPREEDGAVASPPVPTELIARARGMARESLPAPDLSAELQQEREARGRDAAMLGELFMRVCDADAKRRTSELAAEALAQRVATLESELREARAIGAGQELALGTSAEARVRELEQRLHAAEGRVRESQEKLAAAEERQRIAEQSAATLEHAARAAKDQAALFAQRIERLEGDLRKARSDESTVSERATALSRKVDELAVAATHAAQLETQRARLMELERQLASAGDESKHAALRAQLAETRARELTSQVTDFDQRATRAELEVQAAHAEAEAARKRAGGLEAELARLVRRTTELERDRGIARQAEEEAKAQVTTLRSEIEAARASGETQRVELERAIVERSALDAALRTYADSASTVRAVLADLESEEARVAEARKRTFHDARQMLERAERRSTEAREVEASVREPVVKISGTAKISDGTPVREEVPTPLSSPRTRAAAITAAAIPRPRVAPVVAPPRSRPALEPESIVSARQAGHAAREPDPRKKT